MRRALHWSLLSAALLLGGCGFEPKDLTACVENLFVADGALLPEPTGRNPSMTIAALAERVADAMIGKHV